MKVTKEPMEVLKCHECQKSITTKKTLGDHRRHIHNKEMGKNFHDTNGEYVEAVHYSL